MCSSMSDPEAVDVGQRSESSDRLSQLLSMISYVNSHNAVSVSDWTERRAVIHESVTCGSVDSADSMGPMHCIVVPNPARCNFTEAI